MIESDRDNVLTGFNAEYWAKETQPIFFKENVALALANKHWLADGSTYHQPYSGPVAVQTYTKGSDVTIQNVFGTDSELSIDTTKVAPFYVDNVDELQNKWDSVDMFAAQAMRALNNWLDQEVMEEVTNANNNVDDGDCGGSSGTYVDPDVNNILQIFSAAGRYLDDWDVPQTQRFFTIGPRLKELLILYLAGKDTALADKVGENGYMGSRFGFQLYFSNNIYWTGTLTLDDASNMTDGDTVSIANVTFTFKTDPVLPGAVDIGASTEASHDNLIAAINDTGTAGTTYIQLSARDRRRLNKAGIVATDATATTITCIGYGDSATATVCDNVTDVWSAQRSHPLAGITKMIDIIVQQEPNFLFTQPEKKLGRNVLPWMHFGKKVFENQADALVDIRIDASNWD